MILRTAAVLCVLCTVAVSAEPLAQEKSSGRLEKRQYEGLLACRYMFGDSALIGDKTFYNGYALETTQNSSKMGEIWTVSPALMDLSKIPEDTSLKVPAIGDVLRVEEQTFTGSEDEAWTYKLPFRIESTTWHNGKDKLVIQGGHWADPDFFTTIKTNVTENQFWELDIGTRKWTEISPKGGDDILGTEAGAYATAPSLGLGFQVGGRVNQFTDSRFSELGLANNDTMLLASMLIYDFSDNSMRNVSTTEGIRSPWGTGPGPSYPYGGGLVWVPVGPKGHLVFFGGFEYDEPVMRETSLMTNGRAMTVINIYEIATDTWYSQTASGYIPTDRGHFCTSLVAAPDNSSYNIFMHGGTSDEEAFAETYVLSLPAFEWILVSKGNDTQPRSHMNCWTTPQHKLVSLGGHGIDQELPTAAPFKNGRCDPQPLLNVFDTQTLAWEDTIGPVTEDRPAWRVPEKIWEVVGGDETGGAWLREPEAGWSDGKLKALYDDNMPAAPPVGERKTGGVKVASAAVASGPGASTLAVVVAAMLAAIL